MLRPLLLLLLLVSGSFGASVTVSSLTAASMPLDASTYFYGVVLGNSRKVNLGTISATAVGSGTTGARAAAASTNVGFLFANTSPQSLQRSNGATWDDVYAFPGGGAGGDLVGTYPAPTLGVSGVISASYGDATHVPQVSFDAKGRATSAANVAITGLGWSDVSKSGAVASDVGALAIASNLSDLGSATTARTNLGLGSAATQASSTFAWVANNLSDLASASTARTNLGLGTAATQATGVFAQVANNLSDVTAATARTNLSVPPTSRQVIAGTGLTGGGDLTADRTLAVSYGTTSGTATQGNDSRVTGALQASSNLSDLGSATTARTNLLVDRALYVPAAATITASGTYTVAWANAPALHRINITSGTVTLTVVSSGVASSNPGDVVHWVVNNTSGNTLTYSWPTFGTAQPAAIPTTLATGKVEEFDFLSTGTTDATTLPVWSSQ